MAASSDASSSEVPFLPPRLSAETPAPPSSASLRTLCSSPSRQSNSLQPPGSSTSRPALASFYEIFTEVRHLHDRLLEAHQIEALGSLVALRRPSHDSSLPPRAARASTSPAEGRELARSDSSMSRVRIQANSQDKRTSAQSSPEDVKSPSQPEDATELEEGPEVLLGEAPGVVTTSALYTSTVSGEDGGHLTFSQKMAMSSRRSLEEELDADLSDSKSGPEFELRKEWGLDQGSLSRKLKRGLTNAATPRMDSTFETRVARNFLPESQQEEDVRGILRPSSRPRLVWDVLAMVVLVYDLITIPLQVFYFQAVAEQVMSALQVLITLYWLLDIPASLRTAVYVNNTLVQKPREIAKHYFRAWFFFDVLVLTPDIVVIISEALSDSYDSSGAEGVGIVRAVRAGRLLRLLRILRLLRLAKLMKVLNTLKAQVNNGILFLSLSVLKFGFAVGYLGHILACLWFAVGDTEDGWVWAENLQSEGTFAQYTSSVQWALSRVPLSMMQSNMLLKTGSERGLAIAASFAGIGIASVFISSITNNMADIERKRQMKKQLLHSVRAYCSSHHISAAHAMSIKCFVEREDLRKKTLGAHLELLATLPQEMLRELFHEARSKSLQFHDFFGEIGRKDRVMELDLCCKAIGEQYMLTGDKIFKESEPVKAMYIISTGYCSYSHVPPFVAAALNSPNLTGRRQSLLGAVLPSPDGVRRLSSQDKAGDKVRPEVASLCPGCSVSEHALWVDGWTHQGRFEADSDGWLLTLTAEDTHKCFKEHPSSLVDAVIYARKFVDKLNEVYLEHVHVTDLPLQMNDSAPALQTHAAWKNSQRLVKASDEAFALGL